MPPPSLSTSTYQTPHLHALASTLTTFLTVFTHHLLYLRSIYPRTSFLSTRAYNYPVHQSRHPAVCSWVADAVTALSQQLLQSTPSSIALVVYAVNTGEPLERFVIDLVSWPLVPKGEEWTTFDRPNRDTGDEIAPEGKDGKQENIDIEVQLQAVLARLTNACGRLRPLPEGEECSVTMVLDLRDEAVAPAGVAKEDRVWIAAEPSRNDSDISRLTGSTAMGPKTTPVRKVDAGELRLEVWVEEARAKFES